MVDKTTKQKLRSQMISLRKSLTLEDQERKSQRISSSLMASALYQDAHHVFMYVSMAQEVDTRGLLEDVLRQGKILLVPKLVGDLIVPVRIEHLDELRCEQMGAKVPSSWETFEEPIDLVILPCVAVDGRGMRLGRGKGYYDRYLSAGKYHHSLVIAFAEQVLEAVPHESHDEPVDHVLTDNGWLR